PSAGVGAASGNRWWRRRLPLKDGSPLLRSRPCTASTCRVVAPRIAQPDPQFLDLEACFGELILSQRDRSAVELDFGAQLVTHSAAEWTAPHEVKFSILELPLGRLKRLR